MDPYHFHLQPHKLREAGGTGRLPDTGAGSSRLGMLRVDPGLILEDSAGMVTCGGHDVKLYKLVCSKTPRTREAHLLRWCLLYLGSYVDKRDNQFLTLLAICRKVFDSSGSSLPFAPGSSGEASDAVVHCGCINFCQDCPSSNGTLDPCTEGMAEHGIDKSVPLFAVVDVFFWCQVCRDHGRTRASKHFGLCEEKGGLCRSRSQPHFNPSDPLAFFWSFSTRLLPLCQMNRLEP